MRVTRDQSAGPGAGRAGGPGGRWLAGVIPPVCTPLGPDGEVDAASLERHVDFLLGAGVHGLFMLGSSSEVAFLTDAQRDRVLEIAVKTAGGQVPVLAGAIDMTTSRMVDHALRAKQRGVDGVVVTVPFYARTAHRAEVGLHFRTLHQRVGLPLIAYDIPVSVHTKLDTGLALELAGEGVIDASRLRSGASVSSGVQWLRKMARDLVDVVIGECWSGPSTAEVRPHATCPLYRLPVVCFLTGYYWTTEFSLVGGRVLHSYE